MAQLMASISRPSSKLGAALALALLLLTFTLLGLDQEAALARSPELATSAAKNLITLTPSSVGQVLSQVQCSNGYTAVIYAEGLAGPHGLAFNPGDGILYVSESNGDQVSQIAADGTITPVLTGVSNPEGVVFDDQGNLYVVEDIDNGRVVKRAVNGLTATLVGGLDGPEGITWTANGSPGGLLYVTESNIEYAFSISSLNSSDYRTHVTAISPAGTAARILTRTAEITPSPPGALIPDSVEGVFWSYTGDIVMGPGGLLYFSNELSGQEISGTYDVNFPPFGTFPIDYHFSSTESVFTINPTATNPLTETPFAPDLVAPEGLSFSATGDFPLYVAEEDIGTGNGRLSRVDSAGNSTLFCTGFDKLEDVVVDQAGNIYVAEDVTGLIIRISAPPPSPPSLGKVWLPIILSLS